MTALRTALCAHLKRFDCVVFSESLGVFCSSLRETLWPRKALFAYRMSRFLDQNCPENLNQPIIFRFGCGLLRLAERKSTGVRQHTAAVLQPYVSRKASQLTTKYNPKSIRFIFRFISVFRICSCVHHVKPRLYACDAANLYVQHSTLHRYKSIVNYGSKRVQLPSLQTGPLSAVCITQCVKRHLVDASSTLLLESTTWRRQAGKTLDRTGHPPVCVSVSNTQNQSF